LKTADIFFGLSLTRRCLIYKIPALLRWPSPAGRWQRAGRWPEISLILSKLRIIAYECAIGLAEHSDMYAVFRSGGKQYRASKGDRLKLEKITGDEGATVRFEEVLLVGEGKDIQVGTPLVDGTAVNATVVRQGRTGKVSVTKFRRRQNYLRQHTHRQQYTEVEITGISGVAGGDDGESSKAASKDASAEAAPKKAPGKKTAKKKAAPQEGGKKKSASKASSKETAGKKTAGKKTAKKSS
jgi:large subunit ribosomal protein L21